MVRATFAGFSTALSAMQANQKRLDIVGHNLANMNTAGYTRQELQVSSLNYTHPISHYMNGSNIVVGFGTKMDRTAQIRDPYLDIQYRNQMYKSGYTDSMQSSLDRLSDIFDESHITGIRNAFDDVQSTLQNIHDSAKVSDPIYAAELRSRMQTLTNRLNDASRQIDEAEKVEFSRLDGTGSSEQGDIQKVNDLLRQIGDLNRQIKTNQIYSQPSLELLDERNVLLDELSSYIPIEVTYYTDLNSDGIAEDESLLYERDKNGNVIGKKEWPDDLRVEMVYQDKDGNTQRLTLVEGTIGKNDDNYGQLSLLKTDETGQLEKDNGNLTGAKADINQPTQFALSFQGAKQTDTTTGVAARPSDVLFSREYTYDSNTPPNVTSATVTNHFADGSGTIQSKLDMLWKDGKTTGIDEVRGYEYYRKELDTLANSFATVMNTLNNLGNGDPYNIAVNSTNPAHNLLASKDKTNSTITAGNIGISDAWIKKVDLIGTVINGLENGGNQTDTVLSMYEAMKATYPYDKTINVPPTPPATTATDEKLFPNIKLDNNSFANYMNHVSTILANDSYSNTVSLKTDVTVLNGIQDARDSMSGVSLDEEASNMMMYMSSYSAASRLMNTLNEALEMLINLV